MIDVEDRLRHTLRTVASSTSVGPVPNLAPRPSVATSAPVRPLAHRVGRTVLAATGAVLVSIGGVGVAAGAGVLPQSFVDAMSSLGRIGVDPTTAQLAGTLPGPDGQRFEAWRTTGAAHMTCLSIWLVPSTTKPGTASATPKGGASTCRTSPAATFGQGWTVDGDPLTKVYVYKVDAGSATSATLRLGDGTVVPALVSDGLVLGWFRAAPSEPEPVLTGSTSGGATVGTMALEVPPRG